jgi:hypothetical protein
VSTITSTIYEAKPHNLIVSMQEPRSKKNTILKSTSGLMGREYRYQIPSGV